MVITTVILTEFEFIVNLVCYTSAMIGIKPDIDSLDLEKLDVRVGTVINAECVGGSSKLIKLEVDFGELGKRQILTGMQKWYKPEDFVGMQTAFVINLKPRKMMGLESQGMIFVIGLTDDTKPVFLIPQERVENGEGVR